MRLSQAAYLDLVPDRFNMTNALPANTPMTKEFGENAGLYEVKSQEERNFMSSVPCRELIGCLLYLARQTRPDISFAVNELCRFISDPSKMHWKAASRVLRYLAAQ